MQHTILWKSPPKAREYEYKWAIYVFDDGDNRAEEQLEVTTDAEEELLIQQASSYYRWLYKPKNIQQEDMDTMLDTLRENQYRST